MAIGFEYRDTYIAACLKPFSSHRAGVEHERNCPRCQAIIRGEDDQEEDETEEEEFCDE